MKTLLGCVVALLVGVAVLAQEKPVPKDSSRIFVPGCSKNRTFVVAPRGPDQPGRSDVAPGTRMRLNGPKQVLEDIKKLEGALIEITGLVRKSDLEPRGVGLGGGVRISPGMPPSSSTPGRESNVSQIVIDVEGFRVLDGGCPSN
jgi:hypothetical protein